MDMRRTFRLLLFIIAPLSLHGLPDVYNLEDRLSVEQMQTIVDERFPNASEPIDDNGAGTSHKYFAATPENLKFCPKVANLGAWEIFELRKHLASHDIEIYRMESMYTDIVCLLKRTHYWTHNCNCECENAPNRLTAEQKVRELQEMVNKRYQSLPPEAKRLRCYCTRPWYDLFGEKLIDHCSRDSVYHTDWLLAFFSDDAKVAALDTFVRNGGRLDTTSKKNPLYAHLDTAHKTQN